MAFGDKQWAAIGKFVAMVGGVSTVIGGLLAVIQLREKLRPSDVRTFVDLLDYSVHPDLEKQILSRLDLDVLPRLEARWKKQDGLAVDGVVADLRSAADFKPVGETAPKIDDFLVDQFNMWGHHVVTALITNDGDQLVEEARLALPGDGVAIVRDLNGGWSFREAPSVSWKGDVPLGTLRPHTTKRATIWYRHAEHSIASADQLHVALTYKGGTGNVLYLRRFYGWWPDRANDYLDLPTWVQVLVAALILSTVGAVPFFVGLGIRRIRRKHSESHTSTVR